MNVIPTAAVVAAETAFVAAIPLPEPGAGAEAAVGPAAGSMPPAATKFVLCLDNALAVAPAAIAPVAQAEAARLLEAEQPSLANDVVPANMVQPTRTPPQPAMRASAQPPVAEDPAATQVRADQVALPSLSPEADRPPLPQDAQPPTPKAPAEPNQAIVPLATLKPGPMPGAKATARPDPVQRRATPQAMPQPPVPAPAPVLPIAQMPAAAVADASIAQLPPDHASEPTAAPAPAAVAVALAPVPATPAPVTPPTGPDKPPAEPAPIVPDRDVEADAASPVQPAPPPPAAPAAAAMPDVAAPVRLEPASTTPAAPAHAAPSPAAQLAPAVVALAARPDGTRTLTMRLDPPELGQVRVAIERPQDAPPRVDITVERSETLTLLLRDQPQLQRVLDQAGVPSEGRSVAFHLATPEPSARPETPVFATPTGAAAYAGDDRRGAPREPMQQQPQPQSETAADQTDHAQPPPIWLRAGLDITA